MPDLPRRSWDNFCAAFWSHIMRPNLRWLSICLSSIICRFVPFSTKYIILNLKRYIQNILYKANIQIINLSYCTELPTFVRNLLLPSSWSWSAIELHFIASQDRSLDTNHSKTFRFILIIICCYRLLKLTFRRRNYFFFNFSTLCI